mmetsp:Transcript_112267/g.324288  ORF Transcript_112267/g.324288 Transcript_112267/m.324288 type:complete len:202 (-) Transcript_112267:21-626(-)
MPLLDRIGAQRRRRRRYPSPHLHAATTRGETCGIARHSLQPLLHGVGARGHSAVRRGRGRRRRRQRQRGLSVAAGAARAAVVTTEDRGRRQPGADAARLHGERWRVGRGALSENAGASPTERDSERRGARGWTGRSGLTTRQAAAVCLRQASSPKCVWPPPHTEGSNDGSSNCMRVFVVIALVEAFNFTPRVRSGSQRLGR